MPPGQVCIYVARQKLTGVFIETDLQQITQIFPLHSVSLTLCLIAFPFFQVAAKQAAAAATQTIAASQNAAISNKNTAAHQQLVQSCKVG